MFRSVHYLRGAASLFVVCFHFRFFLNDAYSQKNLGDLLFGSGSIGVDIFFIISGFIIMLATERDLSVKSFLVKRFFRIYPIYLLLNIFKALTIPLFLIELLKSLFFVHLDYSSEAPTYGYSLIYVAWTLTYEIIFYGLFALSMILSHKYRGITCILIIILSMSALQIAGNGFVTIDPKATTNILDNQFIFKILASPLMLEFASGIFCYYLMCWIRPKLSAESASLKSAMIFLVALSTLLIFSGDYSSHYIVSGGMISIILFMSLVIYELAFGLKDNKALTWLGDVSYSLYLAHPIVMLTFKFNNFSIPAIAPQKGLYYFLTLMLFTLILSHLLHNFVEKPCISLCRRLLASTGKKAIA